VRRLTLDEMNRRHRLRYKKVDFFEGEAEPTREEADAWWADYKAKLKAKEAAKPRVRTHFVRHDTIANTQDLRSLKIQTGRDIGTRCELDTYLTETGERCTEKGDSHDRRSREMEEWIDSGETKQARGPLPEILQKSRWATTGYEAPKQDIQAMYREKKQELSQ